MVEDKYHNKIIKLAKGQIIIGILIPIIVIIPMIGLIILGVNPTGFLFGIILVISINLIHQGYNIKKFMKES